MNLVYGRTIGGLIPVVSTDVDRNSPISRELLCARKVKKMHLGCGMKSFQPGLSYSGMKMHEDEILLFRLLFSWTHFAISR